MATSLQTGGTYLGYVPINRKDIPWLRPYKQEGYTMATSLQTGGTHLGYVPTNRRDIPWLRPYKQEGHTVVQLFSLQPVTADVRVRSQVSLYGVYGV